MMNKFEITRPGKYEYEVVMDEPDSEKGLLGVVKAETEGDYEINLLSRHLVGKTKCRVEVRGVVSNGARVRIKGRVVIAEGASKSDSFLAMKLLMLDNKSSAVAEPELEIENDEVKASHSASVGRIDEEQLFYLESRGIEEKEARDIIVEGFLKEIKDKILSDTVTR